MNDISYEKFVVGKDDLFDSLQNITPKKLYNQLDYGTIIPDEYIKRAHLYYFGYNLNNLEDEFHNLLSLIPYETDIQPITDNSKAKEEYHRLNDIKFSETNPGLKKIIKEQLLLAKPNEFLINKIKEFLLSIDENADLSKLNKPFDIKIRNALREIEDRIRSQKSVLDKQYDDCQNIFVLVYYKNLPIGGIVIFYNMDYRDDNEVPYIYIQEITKYPVIYIMDILYPEYTSHIPKLNSVLDPIIEDIGRELQAEYIYVNPIGKQGDILEKYYGYKINNKKAPKTCNNMALTPGYNNYYKKI